MSLKSRALKEEIMGKKKQTKKETSDTKEYSDLGGLNFDPKKFKKGKK
jgi:hypothetical protein